MLSDLQAIEVVVDRAKCPEDVFGALGGATPADLLAALKKSYLHTIQVVHPDKYNGDSVATALAQKLFNAFSDWKAKAEAKVKAGTYGDNKPHEVVPPPAPAHGVQIIQTPKRKYIVTDLIATGDLADLYKCTYTEGADEHHAAFKIVQSAGDNDLLENEHQVLHHLLPLTVPKDTYTRHLPRLLDSFALRDKGANRRVNVFQLAEGYVSLADVLKVYPKGVDYRDAVWMFKRSLVGLGYAHSKMVVHGAVLPTHVLVHPTRHGAKIIDWCYAVRDWRDEKGRVKAISKAYRAFYPPEILTKKPVSPQTDLYMLAKCMVALVGGNVETNQMPDAVPKQVRMFFASCLIEARNRRPDDAWKLHEEFDELLQRLLGKPQYRPLHMP